MILLTRVLINGILIRREKGNVIGLFSLSCFQQFSELNISYQHLPRYVLGFALFRQCMFCA